MDAGALGRWEPLLAPLLDGAAFEALMQKVEAVYAAGTVYPPREEVFRAFVLTPPEAVRVVKSLPRFNPGRQQGKPVSVWFTLPIRFQIQ